MTRIVIPYEAQLCPVYARFTSFDISIASGSFVSMNPPLPGLNDFKNIHFSILVITLYALWSISC